MSRQKLLLHFDINKTIVISDSASGCTLPMMLNSLLSECVWGRVNTQAKTWEVLSKRPSPLPPLPLSPAGSEQRPQKRHKTEAADTAGCEQVMSYGRFLETVAYPYGDDQAANEKIKAHRQAIKRSFTSAGKPGAAFERDCEQLLKKLRLPEHVAQAPTQDLPQELRNGNHFILPSFFRLLEHLKEEKRDFTIIFRTFGEDAEEVAKELNLYCEGKHPVFPDARFDGSDGSLDLRLDLSKQAHCLYRSKDGATLALGTLKQAPIGSQDIKEFYAQDKKVKLVHGFQNIYLALRDLVSPTAKAPRVFMLRDYFPFWHQQSEHSSAGKPLIVSRRFEAFFDNSSSIKGQLSVCSEPTQIFFDDNIELDDPHIVDARYEDGSEIPWSFSQHRYLVKAEPYASILDPDYFIKELQRVEKLWQKEG
eukprot:g20465.t1